jgi:hypothetical protein
MQLTELALSMFGARSGWVDSMPLSRTPTVTLREPSVMSCALSALMIWLFHCSFSRGSFAGAAAETSPAEKPRSCGCSAVRFSWAGPDWAAGSGEVGRVSGVPSFTAAVRLGPALSTPRALRTSSRKLDFVEWAITTPICGQDCTTTPPATLTARSASRV